MKKASQVIENDDHPSAEKANRFPEDILLRGHGFVIKDRPSEGETLWKRAGQQFTHKEALALVRKAIKQLEKSR